MSRHHLIILLAIAAMSVGCNRGEFGKRAEGGVISADARDDSGNNANDEVDGLNNQDSDPTSGDLNNAAPNVGGEPADRAISLYGVTHNIGVAGYRSQSGGDENVVVSALGLTQSIAIATLGADEDANAELFNIVGTTYLPEEFNGGVSSLLSQIQTAAEPGIVRAAPSVWAQSDAMFESQFLNDLYAYHELDVRLVNFNSPDSARLQINNWYRNQTGGYITEAVSPRGISTDSGLAFVDATFFSGAWEVPFDRDLTMDDVFMGRQERVLPFMERSDVLLTAQDNQKTSVILPFSNQLVMVAVLPNDGAFDAVEASMGPEFFQQIIDSSEPQFVTLRMPKVELAGRLDSSASEDLGLGAANKDGAYASIGDGLGAGAFIQRSKIAFTELGAQGADPSPPEFNDGAAGAEDSIPVVLNRPFIFGILDSGTNTLVYLGRMVR